MNPSFQVCKRCETPLECLRAKPCSFSAVTNYPHEFYLPEKSPETPFYNEFLDYMFGQKEISVNLYNCWLGDGEFTKEQLCEQLMNCFKFSETSYDIDNPPNRYNDTAKKIDIVKYLENL